jgi:hypothetical protein
MPAVSSIATIDNPEFINVESINNFAAKCQIKVMYVGENRNRSVISKEVATKMAATLKGSPIVGYYKEEKQDFRDHGEEMKISGDGIEFKKNTRPYGFIPTDAKIWFQFYEDLDEFGNTCLREYLCTEGYLWTQYDEAKLPLEDGGRPQSMELNEETLQGRWAEDYNRNMEFFIINDAEFKALCILGKDVEPCFEGSDVTSASNFTTNNEFMNELSNVMKKLQFTLNKLEGGQTMDKVDETTKVENQFTSEEFKKEEENANVPKEEKEVEKEEETKEKEVEKDEEKDKKKEVANNSLTEFDDNNDDSNEDDDEEEKEDTNSDSDSKEKEKKKDYSLMEQEYEELKTKFTALEASYNELVEFKNKVEDEEKDKLISSFYMLDDEDKKDVIENKSKYSLDDIESKLSVICVRKKVSFDLDKEVKEEKKEEPTIYDLKGALSETEALPAWLKAVEQHSN